ncbi:methyl-accepting protein RppA [Candidatus Vecturithrix granuli]|uniref:Methyl-accepting protein RppA n=1 Tax=Vecturithrix granuli TaxID=1499967 RepID=A0A081BTP7_VECG1|nr:methyl-accepting protein RppA [Candidatus Vecturithrix granuli]
MRKFTIGWSIFWINIISGTVSALGIFGGIKLFHIATFTLAHLFAALLFFTGVTSIAHTLFNVLGIRPSLRRLLWMADLQRPEPTAYTRPHLHTRELHELANLLESNKSYVREVTSAGIQILEQGGVQTISPKSATDPLGIMLQRYIQVINIFEDTLQQVIHGNLRILFPREEELKVIQSLRMMVLEIRRVIKDVRCEVGHIVGVSSQVAAMAQQGSRNADLEDQAIEHIAHSIHAVAENLRKVMENISFQIRSLDDTFTAIEGMLASIDDVSHTVHQLSSASQEMANSVEEIHTFTQEIEHHAQSAAEISGNVSEQAKEGLHAVAVVIEGIQTIKSTVQDAAATIQRLGKESGRIGEVLEVINDVAEQTNLLALNATIIAAQAGEQGRGFSVVAEEIKGLAERTRSSTKEIAEIIASVQNEVKAGMKAMEICLLAVDEGVELANQSGDVLKTIVRGIQASRKMIATMASATITQTENSQQLKVVVEEMNKQLLDLHTTINKQGEENSHMADLTRSLRQITQQIEQSAVVQSQETDAIVQAIEHIQPLVAGSSKMTHLLAQSSFELGKFESHLVESLGQIFISPQLLPPDFDPQRPTVAFLRQGTFAFYDLLSQGVTEALASENMQVLSLSSQNDIIRQAENVNWLLRQPWLKAIIIGGVDDLTTSRLLLRVRERHIPLVVVDTRITNAAISVISDNERGGEYAAEGLGVCVPPGSPVLVCGSRHLNSLNERITGFLRKAEAYQWNVMEIFVSVYDRAMAKTNILDGLRIVSNVRGMFLSNESMMLAYLELVKEGRIDPRSLYVVGFDMTPEIAEAILEEHLLFSIVQAPLEIGSAAVREILFLLEHPEQENEEPRVKLIPVMKMGKQEILAMQE